MKPAPAPAIDWAIITPSYDLDLERCRLLCRSMDAFATGPWHHYIIVDPVDVPLFQPLAGPRRTIINKKDILPKGYHFIGNIPFMRLGRVWWSWRNGPVLGWQMQQYVKLLMAQHVHEAALLFCDSDLFFLKPFDVGNLVKDGKVRFMSSEMPELAKNADIAASLKLIGLDPAQISKFWAGDVMIDWHRATVLEMLEYIGKLHNRPWLEALGWKIRLSEYHIYGAYVTYIQKTNPHLFHSDTSYSDGIWTKEQAAKTDLRTFCANLAPDVSVVCVQSLIGWDFSQITEIVDAAITGKSQRQPG